MFKLKFNSNSNKLKKKNPIKTLYLPIKILYLIIHKVLINQFKILVITKNNFKMIVFNKYKEYFNKFKNKNLINNNLMKHINKKIKYKIKNL